MSAELLLGTSTKPSFVVWDKVYQKLSDADDARWLLRAAHLALLTLETELGRQPSARYVLCCVDADGG